MSLRLRGGLADIVGVKKCAGWQAWFNKVSRNSVDFVICDQAFVVLACIGLDGKTHELEAIKKADDSTGEALNAAGIPVVRIDANKLPPAGDIKVMPENAIVKLQSWAQLQKMPIRTSRRRPRPRICARFERESTSQAAAISDLVAAEAGVESLCFMSCLYTPVDNTDSFHRIFDSPVI